MYNNFNEFNLVDSLNQVIGELGYKKPTDIQAAAIPYLLEENNDFVGQAQTGTGKTAAYLIPILSKLNQKKQTIQAVILAPTRELVNQIEDEVKKLTKYMKAKSLAIYGGVPYEKQIQGLRIKPQIIIATPGRLLDLIKQKKLSLTTVQRCVLDEADEMLAMGFFEEVNKVIGLLNGNRQLMMFSATIPKKIKVFINKEFRNPHMIHIEKKTLSNMDIEQKYFIIKDKYLKEALARVIDISEDVYGVVFCRTKLETIEVGDDLKKRGLSVEVLNGDMDQISRDTAMKNFKNKKSNLLVCTDVAARGIDIQNLTHVFNYGIPNDNETYVHRIGRTGRAGNKGVACTFVTANTAFIISSIEKHTKQKMIKSTLPSVEELKLNLVRNDISQAKYILEAVKNKGKDFRIEDSFEEFKNTFSELTQDELLKVMFVWKFNKDIRRYNNIPDIEYTGKLPTGDQHYQSRMRSRNISKRRKKKS
jgi:ATP-dependent RNA helicase DeaD